MASDPLASLKTWPITVNVGGHSFIIENASALSWLEILFADRINVLDIVPGLLALNDQLTITEMLAESQIELQEIREVALDAMTVAAGHQWWWCLGLLYVAKQHWDWLYGQLILHGLDVTRISLAAFLEALYYLCVQNLDEQKKKIFDMELSTPPEGTVQEFDEDVEGRAFMEMMQQAQQLPNS